MAKRQIRVIPIRRDVTVSNADELVPDFAYTFWQSSAFLGGWHSLFNSLRRAILVPSIKVMS